MNVNVTRKMDVQCLGSDFMIVQQPSIPGATLWVRRPEGAVIEFNFQHKYVLESVAAALTDFQKFEQFFDGQNINDEALETFSKGHMRHYVDSVSIMEDGNAKVDLALFIQEFKGETKVCMGLHTIFGSHGARIQQVLTVDTFVNFLQSDGQLAALIELVDYSLTKGLDFTVFPGSPEVTTALPLDGEQSI